MWPAMLASSASGFLVLSFVGKLVPAASSTISIPTTASALVVGLLSNLYARFCRDISVGPLLSGIMFLVPGSLAVRSSLEFSNRQTSLGVEFVWEMLQISMSVTIGLLLASVLVFPLSKTKRFYMAY